MNVTLLSMSVDGDGQGPLEPGINLCDDDGQMGDTRKWMAR